MWVQSLGWEDPLEKEMETHSSILAQEIPWTEESGRLQSMGLQRVRQDWTAKQQHTSHGLFAPMMEHGRDGCWSTKVSGSHKTVLIVCSGWRTPWWINQNFPRHFHPTVFIFFFFFGVRLVCNWGLLHTCLATSLFSFIQTFPWTKSFYINPVLASASWRTRTNISLLDSLRFSFWKSVSPYQSMVVEPEQWEDGALWVLVASVVAGCRSQGRVRRELAEEGSSCCGGSEWGFRIWGKEKRHWGWRAVVAQGHLLCMRGIEPKIEDNENHVRIGSYRYGKWEHCIRPVGWGTNGRYDGFQCGSEYFYKCMHVNNTCSPALSGDNSLIIMGIAITQMLVLSNIIHYI